MWPQRELKSKRRSKTQKETPEESSPNGQDEIDVEDPHPDRPESPSLLMSTWNHLRDNLEDTMSNVPCGTCDTSDRPTQGDTPYALQWTQYYGTPTSDTGPILGSSWSQ